MKARVKSQDHINLDGVSLGTASIIVRALKLLVEYEEGNEVTTGLGVTAHMEIENAIEEAEAMKDGVSKELRKKRRDEKKAEAKVMKSDPIALFGDESPVSEIEDELERLESAAEAKYQDGHIENQAGYMGSDQHKEDLATSNSDRCG